MLLARGLWSAGKRVNPRRRRHLSKYSCLICGRRAEVPATNRNLLWIAIGPSHGRGEPGTARQAPSPAPALFARRAGPAVTSNFSEGFGLKSLRENSAVG